MKAKKSIITSKRIQYLFSEVARLITSSLNVSDITNAIMDQIQLFFKPRNWSLLRLDPTTQELYFVLAKGIDQSVLQVRLKLGEGVAGYVAKTRKPMLVMDAKNHPRFSKKIDKLSGFKTQSLIAVPIVFREQVLGVIELVNTLKGRSFTKRDLMILKIIADFSAIALTNAMAYERMSWLTVHDPLTGLYNRRHFNKLVQKEKHLIAKLHAIVACIDVDNFKEINDRYGHPIGDEVLCKTAQLLQSCCRENDFAFRIGGDEFLIVIMNLQENETPSVSKRLKNQLQLDSRNITPGSRFSFGIAAGLQRDLQQLIKKADRNMYKNKLANKK